MSHASGLFVNMNNLQIAMVWIAIDYCFGRIRFIFAQSKLHEGILILSGHKKVID